MAKARSPNYPAIGLPDAIERLRQVYDREHTHKASPPVVAKAMGYGGLNGKSLTVISALKKYGLLEEVGNELKVSADGLVILVEGRESPDRIAALRRAAFAPALFDEIRKNYEGLPSDDNLRSFLLRRGFLQSAVDAPIRAYRETLALVNEQTKADHTDDSQRSGEESRMEQAPSQPQKPNMPLPQRGVLQGKQVGGAIPVGEDCSMSIIADGTVTQEGLERLKQYIDLIKPWFPKQEPTH